MTRSEPKPARARLIALAATSALCILPATAAAGGADNAPTPLVRVTLGHHAPAIQGPLRWPSGPIQIRVATTVPDQELTLLRFKPGYSYTRFLADGVRARGHGPGASAALRRAFADTVFLGGADVFPGVPAGFTVTLSPGTYYLGEMSGRPWFRKVTVGGRGRAVGPRASTLLTASDSRLRTDAQTLPADGTITIRDTGRQVHRINFVPVKDGTTRRKLGEYLRRSGGRPDGPPPPFARRGPQVGTSAFSPGASFRFSYRLPPGEYALVCFQPDARTGKPQTLDGLYTVVTLR